MKKILLLSCLILSVLSCDTPVKKENKKEVIIEKETPKEVVVEKKVVKKVSNTLLRLQKKKCSGDCPVFDVTITKDSILIYNGKKFTNIKGIRSIKLSGRQFNKITKILKDANFSGLKRRYTTSGTKDFAETIISYQDKNVTIRLWKDAPKRLTAIYVFIEDILYDKKYLK
tara:strand:- start:5275 stop:5787 length:513 start_codon:yes stop_codon:yes gene_type:complete